MYEKLYRHRDQFVIIDDVDSLVVTPFSFCRNP